MDLSGPKTFQFQSGGPFVLNIWPDSGSRIEEDQFFTLQFNGPVTLASVQANAWCATDSLGERVAVRLVDGRVLHLSEGGMPWTHVVVNEMPEVMFVIYPGSEGDQYQIKTAPVEAGSFTARMDLPEAWAGLRDAELAAVSGVAGGVFCHLNLFIGGARSLEGAVRMAELALAARA